MLSSTIHLLLGYFLFITSEGSTILRRERSVEHDWGYTSQNGPDHWGGTCQTGMKQSPINIELGNAIIKNFPSFSFGADYLKKTTFSAKNNGHTIHVTLENKTYTPVIYGGGLDGKFIFEQLHFHWESEHEFEGKRADLEMHMVHYNTKYGNFVKAVNQPDGIAVFAVLFNENDEIDLVIEDFFNSIIDEASLLDNSGHLHKETDDVSHNKLSKRETREQFSLRDLLPRHVSRFFRYEGSLTTPGCLEVVQWTVFINRYPVSKEVLKSLRTFRDHDNNPLESNFRPPQDLNGREVYIQIINYEHEGDQNLDQLNNGCHYSSTFSIYLLFFSTAVYFKLK